MRISIETARELLDADKGERVFAFEKVDEQETGTGRWASHHECIVSHRRMRAYDPDLYAFAFDRGLTEYQDVDPLDRHGRTVELYPVTSEPVTTILYRRAG